jgi:Fur family transcriptional regulator, ferric uptake regulator
VYEIDPTISVTTKYRTPKAFEKTSLIKTVDVGNGKPHYGGSLKDHKHLVGIENGQIHEFESDKLIRPLYKIAKKTEFELTNLELKILEKRCCFVVVQPKHCPQ